MPLHNLAPILCQNTGSDGTTAYDATAFLGKPTCSLIILVSISGYSSITGKAAMYHYALPRNATEAICGTVQSPISTTSSKDWEVSKRWGENTTQLTSMPWMQPIRYLGNCCAYLQLFLPARSNHRMLADRLRRVHAPDNHVNIIGEMVENGIS